MQPAHQHETHQMHPAHVRPSTDSSMHHAPESGQHAMHMPASGKEPSHHSHTGHMAHMGNLGRKSGVSIALALVVILLSPMMGMRLPFQITFPGSEWIVLALSSILFFYCGQPFLSGARREIADRKPAMMTLIAMGISVAYIYSLYAFAMNLMHPGTHHMDYFWELATLIVIMLLGHWIEMRAVGRAGDALDKLAALLPSVVHRVENGTTRDIPLDEVKKGDHLLVKAGESIAADGRVISGETTVNESLITGESTMASKHEGDRVIGGSLNGNGTVTIEVTATGESGYLAQVMKLVSDAQENKSQVENLSDRVARLLFYVALAAGLLAFAVWYGISGIESALQRLVTVLVIACPHALGLAIPLVVARSTSLGARNGLLIRRRHALEIVPEIDVVCMDKTGTLTEGDFTIHAIIALADGWDEKRVLADLAALEAHVTHPLAAGIIQAAKEKGLDMPAAENVTTLSGTGLTGTVNGKPMMIANAAWLDSKNISYDKARVDELAQGGNAVSFLLEGEKPVGLIAQGDRIRETSRKTIEALQKTGVEPVMLTGDNKGFASAVAAQLGLSAYHAQLLPDEKEKKVGHYHDDGKKVMMVGDGINDAPSLARADVGVAIGAGTDIAIDAADVILVRSEPYDIVHLFSLAKNTTRKMKQNLWWGAGYNIVAIPLAAGVLAPAGIILSPAMGAVLMSLSTVVVAVNALMLKMD